jgi:hypothetical protein
MEALPMNWEPGKSYLITYSSESGETSERAIDVIGTSRAYGDRLYIRAFCQLRGEERTFRADRVIKVERLPSVGFTPNQGTRCIPTVAPAVPILKAGPIYTQTLPPSAIAPTKANSTSPGGKIAAAMFGIAIGLTSLYSYHANKPGSGPSPFQTGTTSTGSTVSAKPISKPSPPPKPALEETKIAGYTLRTVRNSGKERFEVPEFGLVTTSKLEAVSAIRLPQFVEAMGFFDPELASRYLEADLNGSGRLGFEELKVFQEKTYREFRYLSNETALRPDEFIAAGGGDCEDFALYTAGLLRFWGWEPYIGSLASSRNTTGHAVCLSYEEGAFPKGYTYFEIDAWTTEDGSPLNAGKYVPIDYDHVGALSNAVGPGWKLRSIYVPEKAWGLTM